MRQSDLWHLPEGFDYSVRFLNDIRSDSWSYCEDYDSKMKINTSVFNMVTAKEKYEKMCENGRIVVQLVKISRYMANGMICTHSVVKHYIKPQED